MEFFPLGNEDEASKKTIHQRPEDNNNQATSMGEQTTNRLGARENKSGKTL